MSFSPKNSYNKEEILDCAQGNLFGEENGRLPTPNMLMFDRITEINVAETLKEVRRALQDADVNFKTAKDFTQRDKEKAIGQNV